MLIHVLRVERSSGVKAGKPWVMPWKCIYLRPSQNFAKPDGTYTRSAYGYELATKTDKDGKDVTEWPLVEESVLSTFSLLLSHGPALVDVEFDDGFDERGNLCRRIVSAKAYVNSSPSLTAVSKAA